MRTVDAGTFKEQCLALLEELDADGLVVTKHGRPVARVLRYENRFAPLIGSLSDKIRVRGDLLSTGAQWDADG